MERATLGREGEGDLPPWSAAIPLWAAAGAPWLWITAATLREEPAGIERADGGAVIHVSNPLLETLLLSGRYAVIVVHLSPAKSLHPLHYRRAPGWPRLADALAPGGVLFVCGGPAVRQWAQQVVDASPALRTGMEHNIEPGQDGLWQLFPNNPAARRLIDRQISPAQSLGAWLRAKMEQTRERWIPVGGHRLYCLPVQPIPQEESL